MNRHPVGVILTGGESRRMGEDKAFVNVDGRPLAIVVADALWEGGCHPVECQGGDLDRLAELGLSAAADSAPADGPVAAIADALARHDSPVVVAACDLARLDGDTVRAVIAAGAPGPSVAFASAGGRMHMLSYWHPGVRGALADARSRSYRDALSSVGAIGVDVDEAAVTNINSPDDL